MCVCACGYVFRCLYFAALLDHAGLICPASLDWNDCAVCLRCAFCNGAISVNLFFFLNFLPPSLIYRRECLFHSPSEHPRAITCSNRCRSFSIWVSPFLLMLFELSCLSLRLSSGIRLDLCPRGLWSPPLGSIFCLIVTLDPEGLIFYFWFVAPLLS